MTNACKTYLALLGHLLTERELEGGALPDDREAEFAARLDTLWWQLADEEHRVVEAYLASDGRPAAPERLDPEDQVVHGGDHQAPRKAA